MTDARDRRGLILTNAARLFARKGIGATTVREIADAVGVLSGSLYHHFESKDAIVEEILAHYLQAIQESYAKVLASGKGPAESLHDLVLTSLQVASEQPDATAIYQNEANYLREQGRFASVLSRVASVQQTWLEVIEHGVADGAFRDDIPPRTFYRLIRDAVWLSTRWRRPESGYSVSRLADDVTSVFLNGFAAARPQVPKTAG